MHKALYRLSLEIVIFIITLYFCYY